jgi:hypothetical protein
MQRLANQHPTLGRLLTLARLAFEVGQRQQAVTVLQKLLNLFTSATQTLRLDDEPFLPPTARYACLDPGQNLGNWALSTVLEQLEKLHYFSSYWEGPEALERLETIRQLGFQSPEMERRRQLIRMRFGQQATPEATAVLSTASADNLNIQYWQSQV